MKYSLKIIVFALLGSGLLLQTQSLSATEKVIAKERAYSKNLNSNKPQKGKLKAEDLKVKTPDKLNSKEPAQAQLSSEDLKKKSPNKLNSKEPAARGKLKSGDLKVRTPEKLNHKERAK